MLSIASLLKTNQYHHITLVCVNTQQMPQPQTFTALHLLNNPGKTCLHDMKVSLKLVVELHRSHIAYVRDTVRDRLPLRLLPTWVIEVQQCLRVFDKEPFCCCTDEVVWVDSSQELGHV